MMIALYILTGLYVLVWVIFQCCITFGQDPDPQVNPLSFWKPTVRRLWYAIYLAFKLRRAQMRQEDLQARREIDDAIKNQLRQLGELAYKDPHSFLGVKRNEDPTDRTP